MFLSLHRGASSDGLKSCWPGQCRFKIPDISIYLAIAHRRGFADLPDLKRVN